MRFSDYNPDGQAREVMRTRLEARAGIDSGPRPDGYTAWHFARFMAASSAGWRPFKPILDESMSAQYILPKMLGTR